MKAPERVEVLRLVRPFLERIRSEHPSADYGFKYHDGVLELLEIQKGGAEQVRSQPYCFAMAIFEPSDGRWEVYWRRPPVDWRLYDPEFTPTLGAFLRLVEDDKGNRFFG